MSDAIQPGLIRRLLFTPLRDVVRGRLSGRLDVAHRIDAADIPVQAKTLIKRVVSRTRLWRMEKADVADELIEHFAAALEVGATLEGLIQHFGDERIAAKLIRRSKKRNRSLAQRVITAMGRLFAVSIVFYIGLAVYFFAGAPSVKVNYADVLNQQMEQTPADQWGWPLYRKAMLMLGDPAHWPDLWVRKQSPESANWLHAHADAVELIRQAAAKPVLGYRLSTTISAEDTLLLGDQPAMNRTSDSNPSLSFIFWTTYEPCLGKFGYVQTLLGADIRSAQDDGDGARFVRDFDALSDQARQMRCDFGSWIIPIAISTRYEAVEQVSEALSQSPRLLSDAALVHIAHRLAEPTSAADLIDLGTATPEFLDGIQRIYTDNSDGDGRLTPTGLHGDLAPFSESLANPDRVLRTVTWPWTLVTRPSRKATTERFERLLHMAQEKLRLPFRLANWQQFSDDPELKNDLLLPYVFSFGSLSNPPDRARWAEGYLGQRDGVVVAIALEMYRRQHQSYPAKLDALVPEFLPVVPADRITGGPLHWRLIKGKPVIYSVGADLDDDGGRPALDRHGKPSATRAAQWGVAPDKAPDGDWVLYPYIPEDEE